MWQPRSCHGCTDVPCRAGDRLGHPVGPRAAGALPCVGGGWCECGGVYDEALDHFDKTSLLTEVARTHLLYGEWLRRQKRRSEAGEQLRPPTRCSIPWGRRRSRSGPGSNYWQRVSVPALDELKRHSISHPGTSDRSTRGPTRNEPGNCQSTLHQRQHGGLSPPQSVPKARHLLQARAFRVDSGRGRRRVGLLEGGREQVARGNTAIRPPLFSEGQHLGLAWEVVELVGPLDGPSQCKVAWEDYVFSSEGEDQRPLSGPWADPGDPVSAAMTSSSGSSLKVPGSNRPAYGVSSGVNHILIINRVVVADRIASDPAEVHRGRTPMEHSIPIAPPEHS